MEFTVNLSGVHPEVAQRVIKNLHHADAAQHALGLVEQTKLKKLHDAMAVPGLLNTNIGRQTMVTSPSQWRAFMKVYGQKCWSDPDFEPWVLKQPEHADLRVKDVGMKIKAGSPGKETPAVPEQIYFTDGRYYQCVSATNPGESPAVNGGKWREVQVPKEWRRVLAQLTYENLLKVGGQTDKEELETPIGLDMLDELVRVNAMRETWRDRPVVNR